ncbi:MAG TPA: hypothetical protein VIK31_03130 [Propionibacteriaceae bacterium]
MTVPFQFQNPQPVFQPLPPRPQKHTGLKVGAGVVGAVLMLAMGGVMSSSPKAAPVPATTVTATTTATVAKTSVPASCLAALDDADGLVVIFHDTSLIFADILDAISRYDAKALSADTDKITAQTAKINASTYATDSAACRAASRS